MQISFTTNVWFIYSALTFNIKILIVSFGIGYFELISPAIIPKIREINYLEKHKINAF